MTYRFFDDYSEGAHPEILRYICEHNEGQEAGYGADRACALAAQRIQRVFDTDGDVHFVSGGTQANLLVLASMLRSYQGVIAPESGHIAVHETGAIEATGHKVITVKGRHGKLRPADLDLAMKSHEDEHTVMPAVVYLTQATELGTVYTRDDLMDVVDHAKNLGLQVFVDGARLAMAVASPTAGMNERDLVAAGVDAFTIGGTKVGGMFGEAIVLVAPKLRREFRYQLKQRGALMAKGRFLGLQFARFFDEDRLWFNLGAGANTKAQRLAEGLADAGVELAYKREINQVFPVLSNRLVEDVSKRYGFYGWERIDEDRSIVRLVCSWATEDAQIDQLIEELSPSS